MSASGFKTKKRTPGDRSVLDFSCKLKSSGSLKGSESFKKLSIALETQ